MDPGFHVHTAMGRVVLETARALAGECACGRAHIRTDTLIIPMNVTDYAVMINESFVLLDKSLKRQGVSPALNDYATIIGQLLSAGGRLIDAAVEFQVSTRQTRVSVNGCAHQNKVNTANSGADIKLRDAEMLNKRLTDFERTFINPRGIYAQRQVRPLSKSRIGERMKMR
jgi:hypothetical protein